ncbi:hypothetical protein [Parasitella parasitica]|uniref:Uncharacterized protein n=1 Tax=Parasitella parasitica TaxID=35722 RepID=A0A0B7MUM1_9FUNG|nr:hypothetical protein [Parasitella parasitica]
MAEQDFEAWTHCQNYFTSSPSTPIISSMIKEQCVNLKINEAFADVAAKDWCNEKLMAKNFVVTHGLTCNYQDALQQIKDSLNVLSMKQEFLDGYCKNTIDYLKAKNVANSFKDTYNKELEEFKIQQLKSMSSRKGYRNAIAVTVEEHDRYYQEVSVSTTTSAFNNSHTTQETADFTPEDSNITQETADFTPEDTLTAQKIADSTASSFRTEVFKAGYKYFKKQLSLFDVVNLDKIKNNTSPDSIGELLDNLSYSILQSESKNETDLALK